MAWNLPRSAGAFAVVLLLGVGAAAGTFTPAVPSASDATGDDAPGPGTAGLVTVSTQIATSDDSVAFPVDAAGLLAIRSWEMEATVFYPTATSRPAIFTGLAVNGDVPAASPFFFAPGDTGIEVRSGDTSIGFMSDPAKGGFVVVSEASFSLVVDTDDTIWLLFSAPGASRIELTARLAAGEPGVAFGAGHVSTDNGRVVLPQDMAPSAHARAAGVTTETQAGIAHETTLTTPDGHTRFIDWRFADTTGHYRFHGDTPEGGWYEWFTGHGHVHGALGHDFSAAVTTGDARVWFSRMATVTALESDFERDTFPILTFSLPL